MKTFLMVFMSLVSIYWGCANFEVVYDRTKEGSSFWVALALGCIFFIFGVTVFATVLVSKFWPLL